MCCLKALRSLVLSCGVVWCDNNGVSRCSSVGGVIHKVISKLLIVLLVWIILWIELWVVGK